jgi:hypothetical protein
MCRPTKVPRILRWQVRAERGRGSTAFWEGALSVPHGRVAMPSDWRWFSARIRGPGFGCG